MKSKIKRFFKVILKILKWCLLALAIFLASLFFREQKLPRAWVDSMMDRVSTEQLLVRCDSAALSWRDGLCFRGVRIYDLTRTNEFSSVAGAQFVSFDPVRMRIRAVGARYPRLPDSYYAPGYEERNAPLNIDLPDVPNFKLVLENPSILGLEPLSVVADVDISRNLISFDEVHVEWPGRNRRVYEDGYFRIDLTEQRAHGEVHGFGTQPHIRPLMEILDIPKVMPYYDAFTEIYEPVAANGLFDVNLINNDFKMILDLRPDMGRYNGVAMSRVEGKLNLDVATRGTNCNIRFKVDLPIALDTKGRRLSGSLGVNITNEFARLDFNAVSKLEFPDILNITDFISPETLDFIECETGPEITVEGHCGTCAKDSDWNDLRGCVRLWRGSAFGFKLRNLSFDYDFKGEDLNLTNVRATGKEGGSIAGEVKINMPGFDEDKMNFKAVCYHKNTTLNELADVFDLDLSGKDGIVNSEFELSGNLAKDKLFPSLNGRGKIKITDGHLLQMNLFAGLTKHLAEWVPGIDYIVNQSQASCDFTIENGIIKSDNIFIEGGLISIKGWGEYDIVNDKLDVIVRVQFLKNESFIGAIVHPITWPFTKSFLEFKATGSVRDPEWDYISLIDRVF